MRTMEELGRRLARLTRWGSAPNQMATDVPPPDMVVTGKRFIGVNSIVLRLAAQERGIQNPRFSRPKIECPLRDNPDFVPAGPPLERFNPNLTTDEKAALSVPIANILMTYYKEHTDPAIAPGSVGRNIRVVPGDTVYDQYGMGVEDLSKRLESSDFDDSVSFLDDLDQDDLPAVPRFSSSDSESAVKAQNKDFAQICEARGQPEREPTSDERAALVVSKELDALLADLEYSNRVTVEPSEQLEDARFSIKNDQPTIEFPAGVTMETAPSVATSVVRACAHAELYAQAKGRADRDEEAQVRVDAYSLPFDERENNPEYSRCELAATYAAMDRVTGMPASYVPPASTRAETHTQNWASTLENLDGVKALSRDLHIIEGSLNDDRELRARDFAPARRAVRDMVPAVAPPRERPDRDPDRRDVGPESRADRDQQSPAVQPGQVARKPVSPGGDSTVALPAARPVAPSTTSRAPGRSEERPQR